MSARPEKCSSAEVLADYQWRLEQLLDTYWPDAVAGEHKSADLVRRLLQQRAALFGIGGTMPAPPAVDEGDDELSKLRARRTGA